ncbi:lysozyme [Stappia sp. F7233]|uniref:Lysozyme n=1 Tax=Stappia albiluteola TaxID=2758565 RepID=A0A839AHH1_9HYPH|nr:GH25 family lysozyme [Stappia albiluteola]MBA5777959.1 lysozyme [Stappia albiluteola]
MTKIGIDVSHHQGEIDWHAVESDGVAFAYMKATEGGDFCDPRFAENWQGARIAGVPRGAYHVFSYRRPGIVQAENFIGTVPTAMLATLPPALDLEILGSEDDLPTRAELLAEIRAWLTVVEAQAGRPAMIYTTRDFHRRYLQGTDIAEGGTARPLWLRSIGTEPDFCADWTIWQFDDKGQVKGIDAHVDRNRICERVSVMELVA